MEAKRGGRSQSYGCIKMHLMMGTLEANMTDWTG